MHSRTGFSGSPVFVYRTFGSDLDSDMFGLHFDHLQIDEWGNDMSRSGKLRVKTLFNFLGIHWRQFPEEWEITPKKELARKEAQRRGLLLEDAYIEGMSGMTCVIPAWQILEVLDMPKLKNRRNEADAVARRRLSQESSPRPEADAASAPNPMKTEKLPDQN
jgi:hypothetical protein